jgi:hypothetical protein
VAISRAASRFPAGLGRRGAVDFEITGRCRALIENRSCCQLVCLGWSAKERDMIKKLFLVAVMATFTAGAAMAQDACESKAMSKDGKALAGAAKNSFMKKCMADSCATKAMSADGKPLSGAAKNSFMKKCEKGA